MRYARFGTLVLSLVLVLTLCSPALAAGVGQQPQAPLIGTDSPKAIPGSYIVVFKAGSKADVVDNAIAAAQNAADRATAPMVVRYRYDAALQGFAGTLPAPALDALRHNPNVEYVEADQVVMIDTTQTGATWGLDRIDQRNLPLNGTYTYNYTGAGVTAYIIDTGIRFTHTQFGGRASKGYDAFGGTGADCNGHGTHVAGTVGGSTYGVAKGVTLKAVRVLDCSGSGSTSGVIAGVNWVTSNHVAGAKAVANMSLGGSASSSLDTAVNNSINDGVTYAIAAGNSNANACNYSPARVAAAITVGATTSSDARASYSNYGTCLDLFAPGSSIKSAWYSSDTATNTISGTSMATPHVTGVAALYLQQHGYQSPSTVRNAIVNNATYGKVTSPGSGSPNYLLYSLLP